MSKLGSESQRSWWSSSQVENFMLLCEQHFSSWTLHTARQRNKLTKLMTRLHLHYTIGYVICIVKFERFNSSPFLLLLMPVCFILICCLVKHRLQSDILFTVRSGGLHTRLCHTFYLPYLLSQNFRHSRKCYVTRQRLLRLQLKRRPRQVESLAPSHRQHVACPIWT